MKRLLTTLIILLLAQVSFACTASLTVIQVPNSASVYNARFSGGATGSGTFSYSYIRFGDGFGFSPTTATFNFDHDYGAAGTYTAHLLIATYDSATSTYCYDSVTTTIIVTTPACASTFSHMVFGDSLAVSANTPAGISGMTYTWDFGDTHSGTGATTGHTYAYNGNYTVKLIASSSSCADTVDTLITITGARPACSTLHASFTTVSPGGFIMDFTNTSTVGAFYEKRSYWSFGDGDTSTAMDPAHNYRHGGSYTVSLRNDWYDTSTHTIGCSDSIAHTIFLDDSLNSISGYIVKDTFTAPTDTVDYKVWLVAYDTVTHIVTAVDSLMLEDAGTITTRPYITPYTFINVPTGVYSVKAKIMNGPVSGSGYVPTYHDSSIYWSGATQLLYLAGIYTDVDIWMQHGIVTSSPGFIAGNVLYGAGKTTGGGTVGAPVQGLQIILRDVKNNLVASTYTDASGNYKINYVPYGTYSIYPEDMNYRTIAWGSINVTSANPHISDIDFTQNSTTIRPGTTAVESIVANEKQLRVYPNPANTKAVILWNGTAAKTATVIVANITGQVVLTAQLNTNGVESSEINVAQLQPGLYFMNVISGDMHYTQKLSIQR